MMVSCGLLYPSFFICIIFSLREKLFESIFLYQYKKMFFHFHRRNFEFDFKFVYGFIS